MIKSTKDYSIFKKHHSNRDIDPKHLKRITDTLRIKNLLHLYPIIVDSEMRIIDGQHRLEAAKILRIEVYYQISMDARSSDIVILNANSKVWGRDHYLHFFCEEGFEEYIKLREFMKKHGLSLSLALAVLGKGRGAKVKKQADCFVYGTFKFPSLAEEKGSEVFLRNSQELIDVVSTKLSGSKAWLNSPKFRRALYLFLSIKEVEFDKFLEKVVLKLDQFIPCVTVSNYLDIFKKIYNYRSRVLLDLEFKNGKLQCA